MCVGPTPNTASQDVVRPVLEFCSNDLSALYFDIRKDALYCDRPDSLRRRAARTVMDEVFARLTAWLAPLTPFPMEEAWTTRFPDAGSNCARVIPDTPAEWSNPAEAERWSAINTVLEVVNGIAGSGPPGEANRRRAGRLAHRHRARLGLRAVRGPGQPRRSSAPRAPNWSKGVKRSRSR